MSTGTVVAIIIVVVVLIAVVAVVALTTARRRRLQERFGPEYDRAVGQHDSRRKAESELAARERRVQSLEIRPLDPAARARYAERWALIQEQFVNTPGQTVVEAHALVIRVMNDRGYPTDDPRQITADLSVRHATTLDHYRTASAVADKARSDAASTEELRQAMLHYRALFVDLLGAADGDGESPAGGTDAAARPAAGVNRGGPNPGSGDRPLTAEAQAGPPGSDTQAGRPAMDPDRGGAESDTQAESRSRAGRTVRDPDSGSPGAAGSQGAPFRNAEAARPAPAAGGPPSSDPATGDPAAGDPAAGDPAAGDYGAPFMTEAGQAGAPAAGATAADRRAADDAGAADGSQRGRTAPPPARP